MTYSELTEAAGQAISQRVRARRITCILISVQSYIRIANGDDLPRWIIGSAWILEFSPKVCVSTSVAFAVIDNLNWVHESEPCGGLDIIYHKGSS